MSQQQKPVVLITGGSRGIGQASVRYFKERDWTVVACGSNAVSSARCGADLNLTCDVANVAAVKKMLADTVARYGTLQAIVNNAGVAGSNSLESDADDELWHRIIDVNLHGTYYVCKAALPHLSNQTGRIINVASVLAHRGVPDASAYCTAKHAVLGFSRSLAHQLAPRGITVNVVCPGWTRTDMALQRFAEIGVEDRKILASVPLKRFIEPEEVAAMIYYLCSPAASGVTGQSFTIDGGSLA